MNRVGLLVFNSTSMALKAEGILREAGIVPTVIPTPTEITSDCGIALLVGADKAAGLDEVLGASVEYRLIYPYLKKQRDNPL